MPPVRRPQTLTAAVVSYIRDAVVRGEFQPDQPLPEVRLAHELETSRITVRVALRQLEELGLVEIIPHRGAVVSSLTPRKAWEIFSLRAVLESYAGRLALERGRVGRNEVAAIAEALDDIRVAVEADDAVAIIEAVVRFHRIIIEWSGHELLIQQLANLGVHTRRLILYTELYESDPLSEVESHAQVVEAVRSLDPELLARVLYDHLVASGERLVERMEELQGQTPLGPARRTAATALPRSSD